MPSTVLRYSAPALINCLQSSSMPSPSRANHSVEGVLCIAVLIKERVLPEGSTAPQT